MCKTKEMAGGKYECPLLTPQHCSRVLPLKQQLMYFSQGGLRAALEIKEVPLQLNMCWSFLLSERVIKVSLTASPRRFWQHSDSLHSRRKCDH